MSAEQAMTERGGRVTGPGQGGTIASAPAAGHAAAAESLLEVSGLTVSYRSRSGLVRAVEEVDLTVQPGEIVALVGESGSGKSTTAHAVIGLLPGTGRIDRGRIRFAGRDLTGRSERELRLVRGAQIGFVPQDPTVSLNPVQRVGDQVAEVLRIHGLAHRRSAIRDAVELLDRAGLPEAPVRARQYPHELSGGMRQRALIAMALAARPKLLVADEPTSALDVTVQRLILDHVQQLTEEFGTAVLLVTHDLGIAADRAQRIVVMSRGRVVEAGPSHGILNQPGHPYTRRLLQSAPSLAVTRRADPSRPGPDAPPAERPRVTIVQPNGAAGHSHGAAEPPLVTVDGLAKEFPLPRVAGAARSVWAVRGVSFSIQRGETLALVGESGSGKSTTARLVLRLLEPSAGRIVFDGEEISHVRGGALRRLRRRAQLVYQNPYASLDPRFTISEVITEPLRVFRIGGRADRRARARELVDRVALPASVLDRRPAELSGGQRQRVAIARALVLSPDLVVCDEPVSALDVSVQAQVLDLLAELQAATGVAYLFISHDLAVVRQIAHRVAVMRAGQIVELGATRQLFDTPRHPYTRDLLAAIPGGRHA